MTKAKVIIQPTAELLGELLGGSDQALVDLRQSIVEEFARRHLKAVANDPALADVRIALGKEFDASIKEEVGEVTYTWDGQRTIKVKRAILDLIKSTVRKIADDTLEVELGVMVNERFNELRAQIETQLDAKLDRRLDAAMEQLITKKVAERLAKIAANIQ